MKGQINFFDYKKGFGFITSESGEAFFFGLGSFSEIKYKGIRKAIAEKATLTFEVAENEKGPIATNLQFA